MNRNWTMGINEPGFLPDTDQPSPVFTDRVQAWDAFAAMARAWGEESDEAWEIEQYVTTTVGSTLWSERDLGSDALTVGSILWDALCNDARDGDQPFTMTIHANNGATYALWLQETSFPATIDADGEEVTP